MGRKAKQVAIQTLPKLCYICGKMDARVTFRENFPSWHDEDVYESVSWKGNIGKTVEELMSGMEDVFSDIRACGIHNKKYVDFSPMYTDVRGMRDKRRRIREAKNPHGTIVAQNNHRMSFGDVLKVCKTYYAHSPCQNVFWHEEAVCTLRKGLIEAGFSRAKIERASRSLRSWWKPNERIWPAFKIETGLGVFKIAFFDDFRKSSDFYIYFDISGVVIPKEKLPKILPLLPEPANIYMYDKNSMRWSKFLKMMKKIYSILR